METLKDFMGHLKGVVAEIGEGFTDPDDDWAPVVNVVTGKNELMVLPVHELMRDEAHKNLLAQIVSEVIWEHDATRVGFVTSSWMLMTQNIPEGEQEAVFARLQAGENMYDILGVESLKDHPAATENVTIVALEAERAITATATIQRDGKNPPTLSDWDDWYSDELATETDFKLDGRFAEPWRKALQKVASR